MQHIDTIVTFCVFLSIGVLLLRKRSIVVHDYESGVLRRNGRYVRTLGPGRHWILHASARVQLVDRRPALMEANGQEIPTRDRASVKVSAVVRYRIVDARTWQEGSTNAPTELYSALQIALRGAVARVDLEPLLTDHTGVDAEMLEALRPLASRLGLEIEAVSIKDVAAAGELKRALAEETRARAEGRAKLERARAETAALRNLLNAARLVRENGGLYELRLLETAGLAAERPGNSLHLGLPKEALDWNGKSDKKE